MARDGRSAHARHIIEIGSHGSNLVKPARPIQAAIPSVDRILALAPIVAMIAEHGREAVVRAVREEVGGLRALLGAHAEAALTETAMDQIAARWPRGWRPRPRHP